MSTNITRNTKSAFIILLVSFSFLTSCAQNSLSTHVYTTDSDSLKAKQSVLTNEDSNANQLAVGAERFSRYLPVLEGKRVSLVVNQSSLVRNDLVRENNLTGHLGPSKANQPYQQRKHSLIPEKIS